MKHRKSPPLLIADDDSVIREIITHYANQTGIALKSFETGDDLLTSVTEETNCCLLDLHMPGKSGIDCLKVIKDQFPNIEVIILTHVNQAAEAVEAVKAGAFDYITKPFEPDALMVRVRNAIQLARKRGESEDLRNSVSESTGNVELLGNSEAIQKVKQLMTRLADSDSSVMITGESGTGKSLFARAIHQTSLRASGPFISVSCPSLPGDLLESEMFGHEKGAFSSAIQRRLGRAELANGGTLFLDEIGEMPLPLQPKLLTFLQDKTFYRVGGEKIKSSDCRIISATNRELEKLVQEKSFREDLYFRLNVICIEIPPLRERLSDLSVLVNHFVEKLAITQRKPSPNIDPKIYSYLQNYSWPGNVRELEHAVTRAYTLRAKPDQLIQSDFSITNQNVAKQDIQNTKHNPTSWEQEWVGRTISDLEKHAIKATLNHCNGNKSMAAKQLGIAEKSIYNKIKKYGI